MKASNPPKTLYQNKKGITLTDGFFIALNPRTQKVNVISIANEIVYIHDITRKLSLNELINLEKNGYLDIFEALKLTAPTKQNKKKE